MVEATKSYKERMRETRAAASAHRKAEKAEWQRETELRCEVRKLAREAVLTCIRANGDKLSLYTPAQITAWANTMICKWLVAKAKENIAERNSTNLHKSQRTDLQLLSLYKC
jgi:hypothetical protein